jgi:hypothetical protein
MKKHAYLAIIAIAACMIAGASIVYSQAHAPKKPVFPKPTGTRVAGVVSALYAVDNSKRLYVSLFPDGGPVTDWFEINAEASPNIVKVIEQAIAQKATVQLYHDDFRHVTAAYAFNLPNR